MNFVALSKEDLLVKLRILQAENKLLRNQVVECGKDKAYIIELELKLAGKIKERENAHIARIIQLEDISRKRKTIIKDLQCKLNPKNKTP